jgi:glutathione S-transferase
VLVEFIADLFPRSAILPKDPLTRARARFFVETVSSKLIPKYYAFAMRGESYEPLLQAFEEVQGLLPKDAQYAVGNEFTVADIAFTPFIARM